MRRVSVTLEGYGDDVRRMAERLAGVGGARLLDVVERRVRDHEARADVARLTERLDRLQGSVFGPAAKAEVRRLVGEWVPRSNYDPPHRDPDDPGPFVDIMGHAHATRIGAEEANDAASAGTYVAPVSIRDFHALASLIEDLAKRVRAVELEDLAKRVASLEAAK